MWDGGIVVFRRCCWVSEGVVMGVVVTLHHRSRRGGVWRGWRGWEGRAGAVAAGWSPGDELLRC